MKHLIRRYGDEYHCSCGLVWDVKEDDPHDGKEDGRAALKKIKEMLDDTATSPATRLPT